MRRLFKNGFKMEQKRGEVSKMELLFSITDLTSVKMMYELGKVVRSCLSYD